jgi:hypothetical protein
MSAERERYGRRNLEALASGRWEKAQVKDAMGDDGNSVEGGCVAAAQLACCFFIIIYFQHSDVPVHAKMPGEVLAQFSGTAMLRELLPCGWLERGPHCGPNTSDCR